MIEILQSDAEQEALAKAVQKTSKIKGDIVEVGVYQGGTADIICQHKGDRVLHLFDTWEGIISTTEEDLKTHSRFSPGRYSAEVGVAKLLLSEYPKVHFYKGEFPDTYQDNIDKLSLLHLDVDLYLPTKKALEIFWPKLSKGGKVVLHDYPSFEGVRLAVEEALDGQEYTKEQITDEQTIITK